jgi:hypothetical protein
MSTPKINVSEVHDLPLAGIFKGGVGVPVPAAGTVSYEQALDVIDRDVYPEIEKPPPVGPSGMKECQVPDFGGSAEGGHTDVFFGLGDRRSPDVGEYCNEWCGSDQHINECAFRFLTWAQDYCADNKMERCECANNFGFGLSLHKEAMGDKIYNAFVKAIDSTCPGGAEEGDLEVQSMLGLAGQATATEYYKQDKQGHLLILVALGLLFLISR